MELFELYELPSEDSYSFIRDLDFVLIRPCGYGNEGLSQAITYSLLELCILAQNSYANGLQFVESELSKHHEGTLISGLLKKIKQESASLEDFHEEKPGSDFFTDLFGFSNFLLKSSTPISKLEGTLNSLSKALNLDIRIHHIDGRSDRYCENCYCYPKIIQVFKEETEDGELFSILYHKAFEETFQLSEPFVSCDKLLREQESDYIIHLKNIAGDLLQNLSASQLKILRNVAGQEAQRLLSSNFSWGFEGKLSEIQQKK